MAAIGPAEPDLVRATGVVDGKLARVQADLMAAPLHGGPAVELHAHLDQVTGGPARRAGGPPHDLGRSRDGEHPDRAEPRPGQRAPRIRLLIQRGRHQVLERGLELAERLNTGIVHVNDQTLNNDAYAPFGGTGASGNGSRFGSQSSWDEFTQWQWVTARPQAHGFPDPSPGSVKTQ